MLRGSVAPQTTNDEAVLVQMQDAVRDVDDDTNYDVDDEADDETDESSADKQLERLHLNDLLGYSEKEAEDNEKRDMEEAAGTQDTMDDADEEAALDEAEAEEHRHSEGA